jgi:toxic protein SymE
MRSLTVTYSFRDNRSVPMIRLRGKWLTEAGFQEGQCVQVDVASGRIVLTANAPPPENGAAK